jgi:hypothetical protein
MLEEQRVTPSGGLLGIAHCLIFIAVSVDHQQGAETIWEQDLGHITLSQPFAFKVAADFRALIVDFAATTQFAILAKDAGILLQLLNDENLAAQGASATRTTRKSRHSILDAIR